jgi:hydrogenase/urease accessory protein HupE
VLGNLVGTLLLGLALLRSRAVPAWAAVAVMCWPPLHVAGLVAGSEWYEVTGALLQAVGFVVTGVAVLREPLRTGR